MSRPIIEVRDISKVYRLGEIGVTSLRDEAARLLGRFNHRRNVGSASSSSSLSSDDSDDNEFWALKGVSFDVQPGEVIGIIGKNGAGKSTLLKVISRITEPTHGEIRLRGRVAALLEVGTGFHPELTGRENIYLNGTILGMKKREIDRKLDEIIDFSGIEKHIDTPVKRYSSGMNVRLGFAVAAHLEPEILIVDEVLAVGDAEFQKKCLGKMKDVAGHGRTVLFVSHNMDAVQSLCPKAMVISNGGIVCVGESSDSISVYRQECGAASATLPARLANGVSLESIRITPPMAAIGQAIQIEFEVQSKHVWRVEEFIPIISSSDMVRVGVVDLVASSLGDFVIDVGKAKIVVEIKNLALVPERYFLGLHTRSFVDETTNSWDSSEIYSNENLTSFSVFHSGIGNEAMRVDPKYRGHIEFSSEAVIQCDKVCNSNAGR